MPEIPVGDVIRKFNLPPWLRAVMNFLKGVRIGKGDVTIILDEHNTPTPPKTGLDRPGPVGPPPGFGPRR